MKTFNGLTGECPESRWATTLLYMLLGAAGTVFQDVICYTLISREFCLCTENSKMNKNVLFSLSSKKKKKSSLLM